MNKQNTNSNKWGRLYSILGLLAGIAILGLLIWWTGFSEFTKAIERGGPALLLLTLFYPFELITRGYGWKWVFPGNAKMPDRYFILGFWYCQSVNILIPTATIGGDVVRGRYLSKKGGEQTDVISSLFVDKTNHGITTVIILIIGMIPLLIQSTFHEFFYLIIFICVVLSVGLYLFIQFQRSVKISKLLDRWAPGDGGFFSEAKAKTKTIQKKLNQIYSNPEILLKSIGIRVLGDIAMVGEVWLAAWLMNMPITITDALVLRLISFGVRSAAFFVWGGLGIQEGMYALLSVFVGLSPSSLIVISLATRTQEIITAILGAGIWLGSEGFHIFNTNENGSSVD